MGPTGEIMAPLGPLTIPAAADMFEEQAKGLLAGGVDVLWVETISSAEEFEAAATGIARTGAPWCGTMSFDTNGRTMMGLTAADMVALVERLPHRPLAFGANCGVGASDLLRTVLGFAAARPRLPVIAKGNAGIPKFQGGHIHYDGTPELMADYAMLARDCGARIIGGCCGTTPAHLAAMRAALEATPPGPAPDLDTIAARLGGFSSASDGSGGETAGRERRRRRS
jgi:5-methyltetrahydrofolate--homocysteine methyltransferase